MDSKKPPLQGSAARREFPDDGYHGSTVAATSRKTTLLSGAMLPAARELSDQHIDTNCAPRARNHSRAVNTDVDHFIPPLVL